MKRILLSLLMLPCILKAQNYLPTSGNVGIGTNSNLNNKLVIDAVDNFNEGIMLRNGTGYQHLITGYADGNNPLTGSALQFRVAKNNYGDHGAVMTLRGSGYVGIGTTSPGRMLDVVTSESGGWANQFSNSTNSARALFANGGGYGAYIDAGTNASSSTYAFNLNKSGSPLLYVRGDGATGVNTSSPLEKFSVNGDVGILGGNTFRIYEGTNAAYASLWFNGVSLQENWPMSFLDKLTVAGNVGVGTSNPVQALHVEKSQNTSTTIQAVNPQSSASSSAAVKANAQNQSISLLAVSDAYSRLYPGFHSAAANLFASSTNGLNIISNIGTGTAGANTGMIRFITSAAATDVTTNTDGNDALTRMVITGTGKVGIGTTSPAVPLQVNGMVYLNRPAAMIDGGNTIGGDLNIAPSAYSTSNTGYVSFAFPNANKFKFTTDFDGHNGTTGNYKDIAFGRRNDSDYVIIKDGGNVGIGEINPQDKLSVNGNIKAKKITVTPSGWSDYVFDESYKLPVLADVESFIKKNKRLPDVPSAKEVGEKGVDVGDNQAVLLKKIEELTLYIIEMDKKMKSMEVTIKTLKQN